MTLMKIGQAGFQFYGGMNQAKQIKMNASVQSQDITNRMVAMRQAGVANAKRESRINDQRIAQLESGYSRSGVEMSGDIAAYISEVAATQEANAQQRGQDMFYQLSVQEVQRQNMLIAAESAEKAAKLSAISGGMSGGMDAYETYSENANFWDKYGPAANSQNKDYAEMANVTRGLLGG